MKEEENKNSGTILGVLIAAVFIGLIVISIFEPVMMFMGIGGMLLLTLK